MLGDVAGYRAGKARFEVGREFWPQALDLRGSAAVCALLTSGTAEHTIAAIKIRRRFIAFSFR